MLAKDACKKVFLILDNLRVYHSRLVKAWVAEHSAQIELFYLPSYSPLAEPRGKAQCGPKAGDGQACAYANQSQTACYCD